jgi:7,8-dihydroneopterin aldolase/epimerase/oxygenase
MRKGICQRRAYINFFATTTRRHKGARRLPGTFTISVRDLKLYGYHGIYEAERIIGNWFRINVRVFSAAPAETITSIEDTINYATVFELVKKIFSTPTPLLESICMRMSEEISSEFSSAQKITIEIEKLHAPIEGFDGVVAVKYEWERE